ncbi:MAG: 50S ribosomal protein L13 [Bacteroidia bacterium]
MDTLSYKTISANKQSVEKRWVVIDAEGQILGRLASRIAHILRGKDKPYFTPHVDCGDNVIVINASKIRLTGRKMEQKTYVRYSLYPGGQRFTPVKKLMKNTPEKVLMHAVKGMLPKNRLANQILTNIRIYGGAEHTQAAQNPVVISVDSLGL